MTEYREKSYLPCNVFLIGFMGTGKSTIAKALQKLSQAEIIEMDEIIAQQEGRSISDIFAKEGEAYFRSLETRLITEIGTSCGKIVSCGGGVPMREENVREMRKGGKVILLTAQPSTILDRVVNDSNRPLLEGKKNVEDIRNLMEQRRVKYEQAADVTITTDNKTAEQIALEIKEQINV